MSVCDKLAHTVCLQQSRHFAGSVFLAAQSALSFEKAPLLPARFRPPAEKHKDTVLASRTLRFFSDGKSPKRPPHTNAILQYIHKNMTIL